MTHEAGGTQLQTIDHNVPSKHHDLSYTAAAPTWDEAIPLGNGIMGALVWGDGHPLNISLDRADLWDRRPVPEFHTDEYSYARMRSWEAEGRVADLLRVYEEPYDRPAPTKIPAGRIELQCGKGTTFAGMSLRLRDATAHVTFDDGTALQVFMHAHEPIGMVRIQPRAALSLRLVAPPFSGDVHNKAEGGIRPGDLAQLGYPATHETAGTNWRAFHQQGAEGFQFAAFVAWREHGSDLEVAWSVASSFEGTDPLELARTRIEAALDLGFDHMLTTHRQWWEDYWSQSSLSYRTRLSSGSGIWSSTNSDLPADEARHRLPCKGHGPPMMGNSRPGKVTITTT